MAQSGREIVLKDPMLTFGSLSTIISGTEYKEDLHTQLGYKDSTLIPMTSDSSKWCTQYQIADSVSITGDVITTKTVTSCKRKPTITPEHWEYSVSEIPGELHPVLDSITGMGSGQVFIKGDSIVIWPVGYGTGYAYLSIGELKLSYQIAYITVFEQFKDTTFTRSIDAGEVFSAQTKIGTKEVTDTTINIISETAPWISTNITKSILVNYMDINDSMLVIVANFEGRAPTEISDKDSAFIKNIPNLLKSETQTVNITSPIRLFAIKNGTEVNLLETKLTVNGITVKSTSETTSTLIVSNSKLAFDDEIILVSITGVTLKKGKYGIILPIIPTDQYTFIICPAKNIIKKTIKIQ